MRKRAVALASCLIIFFGVIIFRIYLIGSGDLLAEAASRQSSYMLDVSKSRGVIYDCNLKPLTNVQTRYIAAVLPSEDSRKTLDYALTTSEMKAIEDKLSGTAPFLVTLPIKELYGKNVEVFETVRRYMGENQLAPHVIGHMDSTMTNGLMGIEKAYNSYLNKQSGYIKMRYVKDGVNRPLTGESGTVIEQNYNSKAGVVLTIDSRIQSAVQNVLGKTNYKCAAVVCDIFTGDIKAMASYPSFNPENVAASLNSNDAPFINRAISSYNLGSVFKILVAAAALDNGIGKYYQYDCKGYENVNGQIFYCSNHKAHGTLDMQGAIEVSCNCYFINLIKKIGAAPVMELADKIGFGRASLIAENYQTAAGTLPSWDDLKNSAEVANLGFGQGKLTASPLQVAQLMCTVANTGVSVSPKVIAGFTDDGITISKHEPIISGEQVIRTQTTQTLLNAMLNVVEKGSGKQAKPRFLNAGGKTGTAQTGKKDDKGLEYMNAWFAGVYPALSPEYAIVVLVEDGGEGSQVAAPLFKSICDEIYISCFEE
ncbi:MAG TPA: hypothetical protein DCP97_01030 [Ruminococcaceae bacterium]|nr:hypothetical protein [Oscillospiraceae bacterium]